VFERYGSGMADQSPIDVHSEDPAVRPPVARVDPVHETIFGVPVDDPYRWMETESGEFDNWLTGQGRHTRAVLDATRQRAALFARIDELSGVGTSRSAFASVAGRTFHLRQDPAGSGPVLVVAEDGVERVLVAVDAAAGQPHRHLDWYVPAPDGRHVAYAVSTGGGENCTIRVVDVADATVLPDTISDVRFPFLSWLDGERFGYHHYPHLSAGGPPEQRRLDSRSCLHVLGTDPATDQIVLARGLNPRLPLDRRDRPFAYHRPGSEWVVVIVSHSALGGFHVDEELIDCTLYVGPVDSIAEPASVSWVTVAESADGVSAFAVGRDEIFAVTHRDAPRGRVVAVPLPRGPVDPARRTVVPESERVIEAVRIAGDWLLVRDLDGGSSRLRRVPLRGGEAEDVVLPVDGCIQEWSDLPDGSVLLRIEPWAGQPRQLRLDVVSGEVVDAATVDLPAAYPTGVEVHRLFATARDGTRIPMTVLHRSGLARDGDNPTVLTGYGSYGLSFTTRFRYLPGVLAWVERGGVWAMAHIRGGGENGDGWHRAGRLLAKENTITDFIDCAEYLIASGYTRPARLAGTGGSAGGIPTGGALVRRPDLWGAMVMHFPVLDALRNEFSENGPVNVPEFGSVRTEEGLRSLLIIDSYRRIRDGTPYPAILLTIGRNDPRVAPWQPGKMTARLQAATGSGRPVLLRVDDDAGHGGIGATTAQRNNLVADELAFLAEHIG
jgi:prolyl oligopeptidase